MNTHLVDVCGRLPGVDPGENDRRDVKALKSSTKNILTGSRRQSSRRDTRCHIIDAAARLFSQKGFSGATTREIARSVNVSEANIFRYFVSKDRLYATVFAEKGRKLNVRTALRKLRRAALAGDDRAVFHELMKSIVRYHRRNRDLMRMVVFGTLEGNEIARTFACGLLQPVSEFLAVYIADRQQAGVFRECNLPATVRAILAMPTQHATMKHLFGVSCDEVSDADAIDAFARTALDTLAVSERPGNQSLEVRENV